MLWKKQVTWGWTVFIVILIYLKGDIQAILICVIITPSSGWSQAREITSFHSAFCWVILHVLPCISRLCKCAVLCMTVYHGGTSQVEWCKHLKAGFSLQNTCIFWIWKTESNYFEDGNSSTCGGKLSVVIKKTPKVCDNGFCFPSWALFGAGLGHGLCVVVCLP